MLTLLQIQMGDELKSCTNWRSVIIELLKCLWHLLMIAAHLNANLDMNIIKNYISGNHSTLKNFCFEQKWFVMPSIWSPPFSPLSHNLQPSITILLNSINEMRLYDCIFTKRNREECQRCLPQWSNKLNFITFLKGLFQLKIIKAKYECKPNIFVNRII